MVGRLEFNVPFAAQIRLYQRREFGQRAFYVTRPIIWNQVPDQRTIVTAADPLGATGAIAHPNRVRIEFWGDHSENKSSEIVPA